MSAGVAGTTTFRPNPSYTTLPDVTATAAGDLSSVCDERAAKGGPLTVFDA
jgi:hypothetical protein